MATRAQECERRLRDSYPRILRDAGIDDAEIDELMAAYDSPIIETQNPVSPAALLASRLTPGHRPRKSVRESR